jgi:hypothetical protein
MGISGRASVIAILCLASCSDGPQAPTNDVTESFEGTVQASSFDLKPFTTHEPGRVIATLVRVEPNIRVGFRVSTRTGSSCGAVDLARSDSAGAGTALSAQSVPPGDYCFIVYDVSTIRGSVQYTVTVQRPR